MGSMEEVVAALQQMQRQVPQLAQDNQGLRDRLQVYERGGASGGDTMAIVRALQQLPDALTKMSRPTSRTLVDNKGLGKPQTMGEDAENKFRI